MKTDIHSAKDKNSDTAKSTEQAESKKTMKKAAKTHEQMSQFAIEGSDLMIGEMSVRQAVNVAGQTPCYLYDRNVIKANIERLREAFPKVSLHYAIKANPYPPLVSMMAGELGIDGLDVASGKELRLALSSPISAEDISFAGPAKSKTELLMAISSGILINVESLTELQRIDELCQQHRLIARIALRLNPDFELKSSGMKMGGGSQQFGIDVEQLEPVMAALEADHLELIGLHIFTGSQNLKPESIISAHDNIFALVERLDKQYNLQLKHLNIGGGLGIPYFPGERELDLSPISENLQRLQKEHAELLKDCELILELGRYLVGNAGLYVSEVTDIKESRGQTFAITNGGLHHHLAASGNFGQIIRKNYPLAVANKMASDSLTTVNVVGPLCTPLDILGKAMPLPTLEIGDLVVVYQSGAYGFSASPRDFLSHEHPVELLL